jgi:hygromycin-B 7''-O-kinase
VGECLAALHGVDTPLEDDWATFESEQRRTAAERQRARGLDERWVEQIPAFLEGLDLGGPSVLLHTEVMREHLLVDGDRLSGLFDFEPSRLGPAGYDLASVGLFVSGGDPRLFRAVLDGLGYAGDRADLARRVLGHALLHQYGNFPWYLRRVPPPAGARTLDDLAAAWFASAP